eukprot:scaffold81218_cov42-Phaeocystis_antarctica.AAC.1
MSWHVAQPWQSLSVALAHSSTLSHQVPLPSKPASHEQLKWPYRLLHVASAWQSCGRAVGSAASSTHSSTSARVRVRVGLGLGLGSGLGLGLELGLGLPVQKKPSPAYLVRVRVRVRG